MPNNSVEPKDVLCLLSFTEDGIVRWSASIGNAPRDFIQQMIHVYRASVSISTAFWNVTNDTAVPKDSSTVKHPEERGNERATLVSCENETVILAKHTDQGSDMWFALIGRPLVLQGDTVCHEVLNTLEELAQILFPLSQGDQEDLHQLCDSISKLLTSTPFWNDKRRVTHVMDSLVNFCDRHQGLRKVQQHNKSGHSDPNSCLRVQTGLEQSLESFRTEISRHFGASHLRLCVFWPDMKPLYAEKLRRHEIDLLGWYFSTCVNLGFRSFNNLFSKRDNRGMAHLWYKRRGVILFISFLCTRWDNGNSPRLFQHTADALIDAALREIVK